MSAPEEFVQRQGGGGPAMMSLFLFIPAMAIAAALERFVHIPQGPIPALVIGALATLVYFAMGSEKRVTLDERGVRFTRAPVRFGVRGAEKLEWEVPTKELTHAREVTTRTPSSRGGWNTGTRLYLGDTHALDEHELGTKGVADSPYERLVTALKRRLGDRFTVEQVT